MRTILSSAHLRGSQLNLNAQFNESMVGKHIPRTWLKISSKCFCENKHKNITKPPIKLMDVDLKDTLTHSSNKYLWLNFKRYS